MQVELKNNSMIATFQPGYRREISHCPQERPPLLFLWKNLRITHSMKRAPGRGIRPVQHAPEPILGTSPGAEAMRHMVRLLAGRGENFLVAGEPGTGKRFLARQVHELSARSGRLPFVEITPRTPEGELRVIRVEEVRRKQEGMLGRPIPLLSPGGTLFIRNVHEFGFLAQSRIARFLIQHDQVPVLSERGVRVVFSLPADRESLAPARPLNESLDVYCRRYEQLVLQPLRNRREDIPAYIGFFLTTMTAGHPPGVPAEVMAELAALPYHDNVRELRYLLSEALHLNGETTLRLPGIVRDEPAAVQGLLTSILLGKKTDLESALYGVQRALIRRALLRCDQDLASAAELLGLSDINLRYRLRKFNLFPRSSPRSR
jgi:DNA-binding NtrC family response regulator